MTDVKVEQCDIDLAARIAKDFGFDVSHSDWLAPKFARHRQAAEKAQQERDAGIWALLDEALAIGDDYASDYAGTTDAVRIEAQVADIRRRATAIRSQNDG